MAFSLAGLGQIGSAASGDMPQAELRWQEVLQGRERLQEQQRQRQQQAMLLSSLLTPAEGALPQQGPPGMSGPPPTQASPPQPQTQPAPPMGMQPAALSAPGGTTPPATAQPGRPVPAGAPAPTAGPQTGGGGINFDPMARLRQMAQALARANPGADKQTLFGALKQQVDLLKGVSGEDIALMKTEIAQQQYTQDRNFKQFEFAVNSAFKSRGLDDRERSISDRERQFATTQAQGAAGALDDEDAQTLAEAYLSGDHTVTQGLGWGKQGAANRAKVLSAVTKLARSQGKSGSDIAAARAEFMGLQSAERTLGTRQSNLGVALNEMKQFAPLVQQASAAIDRSQYPTYNAVYNAWLRGSGDTNIIRLVDALNAMKNAYAQAVTRGGQSTDDARKRADEVINAAWSHGQIQAAIDQLLKEVEAAQKAPGAVRGELREGITGKPAGGGSGNVIKYDEQGNRVQ